MLTEEQQRIVNAPLAGPHLVAAGAGTGKTYTLVQRARKLVRDGELAPSELLVITFTKKAANEIADRLAVAFADLADGALPTCGTFHSIAAALLREFAYEAGYSPDIRAIDDARARGVFMRAFNELLHGKLDVPLDAFPLLEHADWLKRDLAQLALTLKNRAISIEKFESDAYAAAHALRSLKYSQLWKAGAKGQRTACEPKDELDNAALIREAEREARNVRVVATLFRRFDALLLAEGLSTYGDLLESATTLLRNVPSIATRLRERWKHALVDEFQDTNPQQIAFIKALFGHDMRSVMAVGDARQSIYEWNGADRANIDRFAAIEGCRRHPLSRNYRSYQQILDAAQHMLPQDERELEDELEADAGHRTELAIRHGEFTGEADTDANRMLEAAAIAGEVEQLLASGEVRPRDVAILLRSRTSARIYSKALAERGIAVKLHGGTGFFDSPETRDAIAWLRLLTDPTHRRALVRVLQSRTIGLPDAAVAALSADAAGLAEAALVLPTRTSLTESEAMRLERLRAIVNRLAPAATLQVADAIREVLAETGLDVAFGAEGTSDAAQARANAAKLVSLGAGFAVDRPGARLVDFLAELDEREALEVDEAEAEFGGDDVAIMTIHGAKGLEWRHVFLANVTERVFPSQGFAGPLQIDVDRSTGALAFRYTVEGDMPFRWIMRKAHDPDGRFRDGKKDDAEERRLAYVALTRAKTCVYVSGVSTARPSPFLTQLKAHCEGIPGDAAFGLAGQERAPTGSSLQNVMPTSARLERYEQRLKRQPSLFDEWHGKLSYTAIATYASCPRLARYRYVFRMPDMRDAADESLPIDASVDGDDRRPEKIDAATFGTIVHRALELIACDRIEHREPNIEAAVDEACAEENVDDDERLSGRVRSAVGHAVAALAHLTPIAAEEEFDCNIAGAQVGGFIDLICRSADGTVVVVDYKTGRMPDEAYALQLALYRIAVRVRYGDVRTAILRIEENAASLSETAPVPASDVELAVSAAARMLSDEPKPGYYCRSCAYRGNLCPEGLAFSTQRQESVSFAGA